MCDNNGGDYDSRVYILFPRLSIAGIFSTRRGGEALFFRSGMSRLARSWIFATSIDLEDLESAGFWKKNRPFGTMENFFFFFFPVREEKLHFLMEN